MSEMEIQKAITYAWQNIQSGRFDRAITKLSLLLRHCHWAVIYHLLAEAYCRAVEPECALVLLDICAELHPEDAATNRLKKMIHDQMTVIGSAELPHWSQAA